MKNILKKARMHTFIRIITAAIILISCSDEQINGTGLSMLGFFSSPDTVIAKLSGKDMSYHGHFMLGVAYKKKKEYKKSIFHFANSCFKSHRDYKLRLFAHPVYNFAKGFHRKSPYYDDALFEISSLFYLYNEHKFVAKFADLVSESHPGLFLKAQLLKARALTRLKEYKEALKILHNIEKKYANTAYQSIIYIRKGSVYEKMKNYNEALKSYLAVIRSNDSNWQASVSSKQIIEILPKATQKIAYNDKIILAHALFHAREYKYSNTLLDSLKGTGKSYDEIMRLKIINLARLKKNTLAERLVEKNKSRSSRYYMIMKAYADELWRMRKRSRAITVYEKIVKSGPDPISRNSLKRIATYLEEQKKRGYEAYCTSYIDRYNDEASSHFLWLMGRNMLRSNNNNQAEKLLKESLARFPEGKSSSRCRFWLYKLYQGKGKASSAMEYAYDMVYINPDSSYTWLLLKNLLPQYTLKDLQESYSLAINKDESKKALFYHALLVLKEKSIDKRNDRLGDFKQSDIDRYKKVQSQVINMKLSSKFKDIYQDIEKYFKVGYMQGIQRELTIIPEDKEFLRDKYIALAHYGRSYEHTYLLVSSYLELLKQENLKENVFLMPEDTLRMLFPTPYKECVKKYSIKYRLPDYVIYSIIKAESLFNSKAVSPAGATGLMQLMPVTARGIARNLKINKYDLKDPCTSIYFGSHYTAWLFKYFKNTFEHVVAGYNAGAGNVDKWKEKMKQKDMDFFIEFTPYIETRYYILRTGKFLMQYQLIYNDQN